MCPSRPIHPSSDLLVSFRDSLDPEVDHLLTVATEGASQLGMPLYLVGGPVRDLVLGRSSEDLDLVVEGDAARLAAKIGERLSAKVVIHSRFGTATVKVDNNRLDLATARKETYSRPGALPKVTPGSIAEDLHRRDFTVNAMALGISGPLAGELLDPTSGLNDIEQKLIRSIHHGGFQDDATRIFRAVRYEQRLGFRMAPETYSHLGEALESGMLTTISSDRLRRELARMLSEEKPLQTLLRAGNLGVLRSLYGPLEDAAWLKSLPENGAQIRPLTLVAALAFPMTSNEGDLFVKRLNMPSLWAAAVRDMTLLTSAEKLLQTPELSPSTLYHALQGRSLASISALLSLTPNPVARERLTNYLECQRFVRPILGGEDLVALGVPQGPMIGKILQSLQEARLEGRVKTRKDETGFALEYLTKLAS